MGGCGVGEGGGVGLEEEVRECGAEEGAYHTDSSVVVS